MRFGSVIPVCMAVVATAAFASYPTPSTTTKPSQEITSPQRHAPRTSRILSFRSLTAQVDNQVIANLLSDIPSRASDITVTVIAGEAARCESQTCQLPMSVRVDSAQGPIELALAVANPRGQISDVQHVECSTGDCVLSLVVERGPNTVSVGVIDGIACTTGYSTTRVNAARSVAEKRKTEWF